MPNPTLFRTQTPGRWNDAEAYGDLASDEVQSALSQVLTILSREGSYPPYIRKQMVLSDLLEKHLSHHVERNYDMSVPYPAGPALVFAESRESRRDDALYDVLDRRKRHLASLGAVGIQIYGYLSFASIVERLRAFGHLAIAYTMHMHGMSYTDIQWPEDQPVPDREGVEELARQRGLKNVSDFIVERDEIYGPYIQIRHDPVERFRIILPLAQPFPLEPESYPGHVKRWSIWTDKVTGIAREGLGLEFDPGWCRPDLLFPLPGHLPDADWGLAIVAGPALFLEAMT